MFTFICQSPRAEHGFIMNIMRMYHYLCRSAQNHKSSQALKRKTWETRLTVHPVCLYLCVFPYFCPRYGVSQQWYDHYLQWNQSDYPGVKNLRFAPNQVWTPDILLYNRYVVHKHQASIICCHWTPNYPVIVLLLPVPTISLMPPLSPMCWSTPAASASICLQVCVCVFLKRTQNPFLKAHQHPQSLHASKYSSAAAKQMLSSSTSTVLGWLLTSAAISLENISPFFSPCFERNIYQLVQNGRAMVSVWYPALRTEVRLLVFWRLVAGHPGEGGGRLGIHAQRRVGPAGWDRWSRPWMKTRV